MPEYGRRSLAEVLPAAIAALGGSGRHPRTASSLPRSRAVALLLVDGLGHELLRAHAADAPFLTSLTDVGPLTVGFPSSTVVSLASLGTGLPPGAHGLVGTSMRVGRDVLDALHWRKHAPKGRDLRRRPHPRGHPAVPDRAGAGRGGVHRRHDGQRAPPSAGPASPGRPCAAACSAACTRWATSPRR